ncbi:MAG: nodulation protein NfeD [Dehalococcoidia bacterium]|nr:nodulation protein NfeD [Dehalococcoidia bacterium]
MRHVITTLFVMIAVTVVVWQNGDSVSADGSSVLVIEIGGNIEPLTTDRIARGIDEARGKGASLVVIQLDTPGGLLESTREIVEHILASDTPVAVFVGPAGARAASAGTFIAAAANFAVMAPGTTIGAASPIASDGEDIPPTLEKKISADTSAFIRSIAQARDRNSEALENTVLKSTAYSAEEALKLGVIDLIAPDMDSMLDQLDGRTATTGSGQVVTLTAKGASVSQLDSTLLERALRIIVNPNVVFALFLIGGIALLIEMLIPGLAGPGILGVIMLGLAFVGFFNLPGSWLGVGLIALSIGLFYGETTAPGFGPFGAGGIIALVLGAVFLFGDFFSASDLPEPSFMVSPIMIAAMTALVTVTWVFFIRIARNEGGTSSGFQSEEAMLLEGQWGVTVSELSPTGKVWVANQEWSASTDPGVIIKKGDEIRVVGVYGEVLKVEKLYEDIPETTE